MRAAFILSRLRQTPRASPLVATQYFVPHILVRCMMLLFFFHRVFQQPKKQQYSLQFQFALDGPRIKLSIAVSSRERRTDFKN